MVAGTLLSTLTKLNQSLSGKRYKAIKHLTAERLSAIANIKANLRQEEYDDECFQIALHSQLQVLGPSMLEPFKQSLSVPGQTKLSIAVLELLGKLANTAFFHWKSPPDQNLCDVIVKHISQTICDPLMVNEDVNVILAICKFYRLLVVGCPSHPTRCLCRESLTTVMTFLQQCQSINYPSIQKAADAALREICDAFLQTFWTSFDAVVPNKQRALVNSKLLSSVLKKSSEVTFNVRNLIDCIVSLSASLAKTVVEDSPNDIRMKRANLDILNTIFNSAACILKHTKTCLNIVEHTLLDNLYKMMSTQSSKTVHPAIELYCTIITEFRRSLTDHRAFYLEYVVWRLLLVSPIDTQLLLVRTLYQTLLIDRRVFEKIFVTHDCVLNKPNVVGNIVERLADLMLVENAVINAEIRNHLSAFLATFVSTLKTWIGESSSDMIGGGDSYARLESFLPSWHPYEAAPESEGTVLVSKFDEEDSVGLCNGSTVRSRHHYSSSSFDHASVACIDEGASSVDLGICVQQKQHIMRLLRTQFEESPSGVIDELVEAHLLKTDAESVAAFLTETELPIDSTGLGQWFGENKSFNLDCLNLIIRSRWNFTGLGIEEALPKFLDLFRLPGEAQKIDRIVQLFARSYVEQNPTFLEGPVEDPVTGGSPEESSTESRSGVSEVSPAPTSEVRETTQDDAVEPSSPPETEAPATKAELIDLAYIICFSVIMLHTDAHSKEIRADSKLPLEDFVRNTRACDGAWRIPVAYLERLYSIVTESEWVMSEDLMHSQLNRNIAPTDLWNLISNDLAKYRRHVVQVSDIPSSSVRRGFESNTLSSRHQSLSPLANSRFPNSAQLGSASSVEQVSGQTFIVSTRKCVTLALQSTSSKLISASLLRALKLEPLNGEVVKGFPRLMHQVELPDAEAMSDASDESQGNPDRLLSDSDEFKEGHLNYEVLLHPLLPDGLANGADYPQTASQTIVPTTNPIGVGLREQAIHVIDTCGTIGAQLKDRLLFQETLCALALLSGLLVSIPSHPFHPISICSWNCLLKLVTTWVEGVGGGMWSCVSVCISEVERYQQIALRKSSIKLALSTPVTLNAYGGLLPPVWCTSPWPAVGEPLNAKAGETKRLTGEKVVGYADPRGYSFTGRQPSSSLASTWSTILKHIDSTKELKTPTTLYLERLRFRDYDSLMRSICSISRSELYAHLRNQLGITTVDVPNESRERVIRLTTLHKLLDLQEEALHKRSLRRYTKLLTAHLAPHLVDCSKHSDRNIQVCSVDILKLCMQSVLDQQRREQQQKCADRYKAILGIQELMFRPLLEIAEGSSEFTHEFVVRIVSNIIKSRGDCIFNGWKVFMRILALNVPTSETIRNYDLKDTSSVTRERILNGYRTMEYSVIHYFGILLNYFDEVVNTLKAYLCCFMPMTPTNSSLTSDLRSFSNNLPQFDLSMEAITTLTTVVNIVSGKKSVSSLQHDEVDSAFDVAGADRLPLVQSPETPAAPSIPFSPHEEVFYDIHSRLYSYHVSTRSPDPTVAARDSPSASLQPEERAWSCRDALSSPSSDKNESPATPMSAVTSSLLPSRHCILPDEDPSDTYWRRFVMPIADALCQIVSTKSHNVDHRWRCTDVLFGLLLAPVFEAPGVMTRVAWDELMLNLMTPTMEILLTRSQKVSSHRAVVSVGMGPILISSGLIDVSLWLRPHIEKYLASFACHISPASPVEEERREITNQSAATDDLVREANRAPLMFWQPSGLLMRSPSPTTTAPAAIDNTTIEPPSTTAWLPKSVMLFFKNLCSLALTADLEGSKYLELLMYCSSIYAVQPPEGLAKLGDDMIKHVGSYSRQFNIEQWQVYIDHIIYVLNATEPHELLGEREVENRAVDFELVMSKSVLQLLLLNNTQTVMMGAVHKAPISVLHKWLTQLARMYTFARTFDAHLLRRRVLQQRGFMSNLPNLPSLNKQERDVTTFIVRILSEIMSDTDQPSGPSELLEQYHSAKETLAEDSSLTAILDDLLPCGHVSLDEAPKSVVWHAAGRGLLQVLSMQTRRYYECLQGLTGEDTFEVPLKTESGREISGLNKMLEENVMPTLLSLSPNFYRVFTNEIYVLCADWLALEPVNLRMQVRQIMKTKTAPFYSSKS